MPGKTTAEYNRKYLENNRELLNAKRRERYKNSLERRQKNQRRALDWQRANPERRLEITQAWDKRNPAIVRAKTKRWRQANPHKVNALNHLRKARVLGATIGVVTGDLLSQKWDYWHGLCWICGDPATSWDHVKPLTKGGAHCIANLRPACGPCNSKKRNKWPFPTGRRAS